MIRRCISLWRTWRVSRALDEGRADDPAIRRLIECDPSARQFYETSSRIEQALSRDAAHWLNGSGSPGAQVAVARPRRSAHHLLWRIAPLAAASVLLGVMVFTGDLAKQSARPVAPDGVPVVLDVPGSLIDPAFFDQPYRHQWSQLRADGRAVVALALAALPSDAPAVLDESP